MSQQVTLQGRALRMLRAGAPVTVGERLGEGGQGVVHAVTIGGAAYAVKWYRYAPSGELRKSIAAQVGWGTLRFMAPEVVRTSAPSPRACVIPPGSAGSPRASGGGRWSGSPTASRSGRIVA